MAEKICVIGESLVDMIPKAPGAQPVPHPGGSPYNVALALGALGAPVTFFGRMSTDEHGQLLKETLSRYGVDTTDIIDDDAPASKAFVTVTGTGDVEYRFEFDGTADRTFNKDDFTALPDGTAYVHLGFGAVTMDVEPMASAMDKATALAKKTGAVVSTDPNLRTMLVSDPQGYRAVFERRLPDIDLLKMSDEDHAFLYGDVPVEETARRWLETGVSVAVLTRGADGATVFSPEGSRTFTVPDNPAPVADTVGAGDCFMGALLAEIARRGLARKNLETVSVDVLDDICRFAGAVASVNCTHSGCRPPTRAETEKLLIGG